jgi:hypothetical protein
MSGFLKAARAVRPRAGDRSPRRRESNFNGGFKDLSRNRTDAPAGAERREFTGLRDDEEMPLICPTCQIVFRCMHAACYFAWGCFRYFNRDTAASALRLGA